MQRSSTASRIPIPNLAGSPAGIRRLALGAWLAFALSSPAVCKADKSSQASARPKPAAAAVQAVSQPVAATGQAPAEAPVAPLMRVESQLVCMVNDMNMGRPQIPVEVDGKTYYGCCEACKSKLAEDQAVRYAIDPVSGRRVDKAQAVIGVHKDGVAVYFENEANLLAFRR